MILKFVYTPKPKKFSYKPVFYIPEEESKTNGKENLTLKEKLHQSWYKGKTKSRKNLKISVLVYLLLISILLYFIFIA